MGKSYLPPGFRFNPTDVELIKYYLKRKIMGKRIRVKVVAEVDIYKFAPWDLPDKSCWRSGDLKWYFFSPREKKYASGARVNRATECGYWKTTGKDRSVLYNGEVVGWIKTLIFHTGRAPKGERTNWVLHEYRLEEKNLDSFVLCMVFQKDGIGPRNNTQYGAPFKEKDWSDDEVETDSVPHVNMLEQDLVHANMKDPDPLPDHVFWNLPEPELVNSNIPECDLVTAGTPEPNHVYENVPDPELVYPNMCQPHLVYLNVPRPDLVYPNMPQPDLVYPSMPQPDLFYPSNPQPDHAYPSMPQPDHAYPSMPQPDLVYPSMPQPDLVYSNKPDPYLDFASNCNSSVATRTNSLESCVSDIVPPSSNVLLSVSPDYDILSMLDCFTEEETFVMSDIHKNQGLDNIIYLGNTHPAADFRDLGKEKYNVSSGHNSFDTADQMPSVDDAFLELFDLQKPLNGNNSLSTLNLPMFSPHRTLLDDLLGETPAPDGGYFLSKDG